MHQEFPNPTLAAGAPKSVRRAAYLMYAGAIVYLISEITELVVVMNGLHFSYGGMRLSDIPTVSVIVLIILSAFMVPVSPWLWMAWKCKAGRPWARTVSTVLFLAWSYPFMRSVFAPVATVRFISLWGTLEVIVIWLIGLGVIIALWQRSSSSYFRAAQKRHTMALKASDRATG